MTQSLGFKLEIFIEKMAKGIWPEPKPVRPIRRSLQKRAERRASRAFRRQARRERRKKLEAQAWARRQREQMEAYYVRVAERWREYLEKQQQLQRAAAAASNQPQQGQMAQQPQNPATATSTQENNGAQELEGAQESNGARAHQDSEISNGGEPVDVSRSPQTSSADAEYTLPGLPREEDIPSRPFASTFPSRAGFYSSEKYNEALYLFLRQGNVEVLPVPEVRESKRRPIVLTNAYEYYCYVRHHAKEDHYSGEELDTFCSPSALLYMVYNGWVELDDVLSWKGGRDSLGRALVEFASRPGDATSFIKGTYPTQPEMPMKPSESKVEWFAQKVSTQKKNDPGARSKWSDADDRVFNGPFGEHVKRFATPGVQERVLKELEVVRKGQQVTVQEDWRPLFWVLFRAVYQQRLRSTTVSAPATAWPAASPLLFAYSSTQAPASPVARGASTTATSRRSERRTAKPYSSTAAKRKRVTVEDASDDDDVPTKRRFTVQEKGKWKADGAPPIIVTPPTPEPPVVTSTTTEHIAKEPSSSNLEVAAEISVPGKRETTPRPNQTHQVRTVDAQATTPETYQSQDTTSSAPAPFASISLPDPTPPALTPPDRQRIYPSAINSTGPSTTTVASVTEPSLENNAAAAAAAAEPSHSFAEDVSMDVIDEPITVTPAPAPFTAQSSIVPGGSQAAPIVPVQGTTDGMDTDMSCGFVNPASAWAPTPQTQMHVQMQPQPQRIGSMFPYARVTSDFGQVGSHIQGASFADANMFQSQSVAGPSTSPSTAEPSGVLPSADGHNNKYSSMIGPYGEVRKMVNLPAGAAQHEPHELHGGEFRPQTVNGRAFNFGLAPSKEQNGKPEYRHLKPRRKSRH